MSLLEKIRADALAARKAKDTSASVLITLIGEIDTKAKSFSPAREMTDDEVVAVIKKFLKGINETLGVLTPAVGSAEAMKSQVDKAVAERDALEGYLPKQMTDAEIRNFAASRIADGANLGMVMGALKAEHSGQYDGKLASGIVRELIAA